MTSALRAQRRSRARGRPSRKPPPLAVIDIGSNSGRVTVMQLQVNGHLDVLEDARAPLRLAREVGDSGRLSRAALDRTLTALRDFRAVALGAGAASILSVATSAVRESKNARELVTRARRELGLRVVVIDGQREAAFAFLGALQGLPVDHGLLFDLGGGSLEVSRFRNRKLLQTWTLPLGALRVSDSFLRSDPPTARHLRRLHDHVVEAMRKERIPKLAEDETLIGTGGTIRSLAKMEARARQDPLPHLHGYVLDLAEVRAHARRTASLDQTARAAIPGLSRDRADSIVGGFLVVQTAMECASADQLQVSGQGLREGIALATLGHDPPPALQVRRASIDALARRFGTFEPAAATRRGRIAARLLSMLDPEADAEMRETLQNVCLVVDTGRSIDYFDRFRNAAVIVAAADLQGFTPRAVALMFATLMQADTEANQLKSLRPVLREKDGPLVSRAAVLLRLADEIGRRSPLGAPVVGRFRLTRSAFIVASETLAGWRPRVLADRFRRVFHRELRIQPR